MRPTRSPQNPDLAIDLGTAMARVGSLREATVAESPARVGPVPALRDGAVVEVEMASEILRHLFRRFQRLGWRGARALACAPSDATEAELVALEIAVRGAGVDEVCIVPEPLAAALGAGADVGARQASMVIDFGEGVTDCAVLGEGRILASVATRGGCCALRTSVIENVARETGLQLGEAEAERLVRHVGLPGASRPRGHVAMAWAHATGSTLPRRHAIPATLIADAIERTSGAAIEAAATFAAGLEPQRRAEIARSGVLLTGGGALIPGLQGRFSERLGLPIVLAHAPLDSVIQGARELLDVASDAGLWS